MPGTLRFPTAAVAAGRRPAESRCPGGRQGVGWLWWLLMVAAPVNAQVPLGAGTRLLDLPPTQVKPLLSPLATAVLPAWPVVGPLSSPSPKSRPYFSPGEAGPVVQVAYPPQTSLSLVGNSLATASAPNLMLANQPGATGSDSNLPAFLAQPGSVQRPLDEPVIRPVAQPLGPATVPSPDPLDLDGAWYYRERQSAWRDLYNTTQLVLGSGTVSPIGPSFLADHLLTGWGIQGAFRRPLCCPNDSWVWFGELGSTFQQNGGKGPAISTSGRFTDTTPVIGTQVALDDFYETQLRDLRRVSLNTAIGFRYRPALWNHAAGRSFQWISRFGMNWGWMHDVFRQTQSAALSAVVAQQVALGSSPNSFIFDGKIRSGNAYFGLYSTFGFTNVWYNPNLGPLHPRQISLGAEIQYSQDWLKMRRYTPTGHGLSSLMPMVTFTIWH